MGVRRPFSYLSKTVIFITLVSVMAMKEHWGFEILLYMTYFVASTAVSEVFIFTSKSVRDNYTAIPGFALLNFFMSGLFVKPQSLPRWLSPWFPSVSIVRWVAQASFIDVYDGDTDTFPIFPGTNWSNYKGSLNLFGWGGKTKWYCLGMIAVSFIAFRVAALLGLSYVSFTRTGHIKSRQV